MLYMFLKNKELDFLLNCMKDNNSRLVKWLYNHKNSQLGSWLKLTMTEMVLLKACLLVF